MASSTNKRDWFISLLTHPIVWSILIFAAIAVTAITAYESDLANTWLEKWSTLVGATVSAIFTIGLLSLYKQQKDLKEAEYRPIVRYEGFREKDGSIELLLSNIGTSPALNLRTQTKVRSINGSLDNIYTLPAKQTLIREYEQRDEGDDSDETPLDEEATKAYKKINWIRNRRNYLNPEERFKLFVGGYAINIEKGIDGNDESVQQSWYGKRPLLRAPNVTRKTVFYFANILDRQLIRITVTLLWEDSLGNQYSEEIIDDVMPIDEEFSRNRMVTSAEPFEHYQQYIDDDEELFNKTNIHRKSVADEIIEQDKEV